MAVVNISGYDFYIDDEDMPIFNKYSWKIHKNRGEPAYLSCTIMYHRFIIDAPRGSVVDHINNDSFDNRKTNLRITTHDVNMKNKIPARQRIKIANSHRRIP